jgi:site-specific DNA recombinase
MCTRYQEGRACENQAGYYLEVIEGAVLATLRRHLTDKTAVRYYVDVYNAERRDIVARLRRDRGRIEMRLSAIEREYERTRNGFIKGFLTEAETQETLPSLRAERDALRADLAAAEEPPKVVVLHAGIVNAYLASIDRLEDMIRADRLEGASSSRDVLRGLLHSVVVHKAGADGTVDIEVVGRLASLIDGPGGRADLPGARIVGHLERGASSTSWRSLVAGEGLEPPTYGL